MKKLSFFALLLYLLLQVVSPAASEAACAKVSIELLQSLTLERIAFDAKMVLTNNVPDTPLENLRLDIVIKDREGKIRETQFFIRKPVLTNITALDGTGRVEGGARAEAHWLIIPSPGAGVIMENGVALQIGVDYWVGATLTYTASSKQETVPLNPAKITVKPMPQLVIDYFMPFNVVADNPFTPLVEPPVPFPLAVRILNDGYGPASKLKIDSAQPKIVTNDQGLLIDFRLLGASVNDAAVEPTLTVNFGDLPSKQIASASWEMISTLTGRFTEFKAEFSHASELGGELTSLIQEMNAHYLVHKIKVNLPGRDNRLDFLADTDRDVDHLPDTIFESEIPNGSTNATASRSLISVLTPTVMPERPTNDNPSVEMTLPQDRIGWIYTRLSDPSLGMLKLMDVVRKDGVHLDENNFWVEEGVDKDYKRVFTLHFVDFRTDANAPGTYTLVYEKPLIDNTPPTTTLIFDGSATGANPVYVTPGTRLALTARDNEGGSGVAGMFRKVNGVDDEFIPAYPFSLEAAGTYTVNYYSVDRDENREATQSTTVIVVSGAPVISEFRATPASFAPHAPKGVVANRTIEFTLTATSSIPILPFELEIVPGSTWQSGSAIRILKGSATSSAPLRLWWDGRDSSGKLVQTGVYTARIKVSDGLDNPLDPAAAIHFAVATLNITADDWFQEAPVDPVTTAQQLHPRASASRVVWQDNRNVNWDVYYKDMAANSPSVRITAGNADHLHPALDGDIIVWQDNRSGGWEIYGYRLDTASEVAIATVATGSGDKERPVVAGQWVVWQDKRNGNWDIHAKNLATDELLQLTSHERDQLHPAIYGDTVVWEDYRHGLGQIYSFNLITRQEAKLTQDSANKNLPAVYGATTFWTDEKSGQKDIYSFNPQKGLIRITYGTGDHTQASIRDDLLVYTDYEAGLDDPNLSFRLLSSAMGGRLSANTARQEEPAVGAGMVFWQDNRSGAFQLYSAPFLTESLPVEVALMPGFNLVAVGGSLATQYPTAAALFSAKRDELGIQRILTLDTLHNNYLQVDAQGGDFPLVKGQGIVIYLQKSGSLMLAGSGETSVHNLLPGTNQIGLLSVPTGYSAYDLLKSVGLDSVPSLRRFDATTGLWQSVTVRTTPAGTDFAGVNFAILPGDGLQIVMKNRVDGWMP